MRVGLRFKVSAFAAILVLVIAAGMAYFFVVQGAERREAETIAHYKDAARTIALLQKVDARGVSTLDFPKIETLVRNAAKLENGLVFAVLARGEGEDTAVLEGELNEELWSRLGEDLAGIADARGETGALASVAMGEIDFRRRVKEFRPKLPDGTTLYLGFELVSLDAALARDLRANALVALGALLLGLAGALLLGRTLAVRIEELALAMRRVARGDLSPRVVVRSKDEVGVLQSAFNVMAVELRKKAHYKETLGRYVSEEVAERLLDDPGAIDVTGEQREVTVLSLDIRGFAELARAMPPRTLLRLLNEYFGAMIDAIFEHEGSITRFAGDSILAVFGAPVAIAEPELRAVRTAVAVQRVVEDRNTERRLGGEIEVGIGIGISTGRVVAGNVGSVRRLAYAVVGEPVNVATQIEALARRGQILLSRTTFERVREQVQTIDLGPTELRGFADPVRLYAVEQSSHSSAAVG